ncbi:protein SMAX1-LIKE 4-like [Bidens hawaiensis]|uniref:protein SMAX1-LIKE 4-like n=1 Tax=Bidens hawaiensis TaxID=980011 RepID=UPI00404B96DC
MRSGGCTVQQTLTKEAASVLKHSLSLARRRGHAQVTPLHVAATLLMSSRASVLRRACIKSQNNSSTTPPPLHCRALELCFNVALNRLPTTPGPLLHGQPSLSNALIAALKRAQAHQRRGCIENQQQAAAAQTHQENPPLLAIKVELEQLILSILDDPSVSRVMREAGFSSTAVKSNLEDFSSSSTPRVFFSSGSGGGVYSSPSSPNSDHQFNHHLNHFHNNIHHHNIHHTHQNPNFWQTHFLNHFSDQNPSPKPDISLKKDVNLVIEVLLGKKSRKNTVIVGDGLLITEGVVIELMGKVERGDVPNELKHAHFIKFQFSSLPLRFMKREEVEMNLADLRRKVESLLSTGDGVIIYAGDLKWTVDESERGVNVYSPVDHLVVEIGRLISQFSVTNKVWLIGTSNYQTFMKNKMKMPSLEVQWSLQAVSLPSGGLGLSLNANTTGGHESRVNLSNKTCEDTMERKPLLSAKDEGDDDMLVMSCCGECNSNYEKEAAAAAAATSTRTSTVLPFWLHPTTHSSTSHKDNLVELRRKWNRLCQSLHQGRHNLNKNYMNSSSLISNENQGSVAKSYTNPFWPKNHIESNSISFGDTLKPQTGSGERSYPRFRRQQSCHIDLSFSPTNHPKLDQEPNLDCLKSREDDKEVKITLGLGNSVPDLSRQQDVYNCLQENVPWHSEKMHSIVDILMSSSSSKSTKKDSCFLIEGNDIIGKRRLAMAIAKAMFGSSDSLLRVNMRGPVHKWENLKRALKDQENVVVLVEDAEYGDGDVLKSFKDGFDKGKFGDHGEIIFILSKGCDHLDDVKGSRITPTQMKLVVNEMNPTLETDQKRKPKWDFDELNKRKVPRIEEGEIKKDLSRQSSSNTLDLNIKAEAQEDENNKNILELSPNSSDLTREMDGSPQNPPGFLETVKTQLVFDLSPARDSLMRESFMFKMKGVFEGVFGSTEFDLKLEEVLLDEVLFGCGVYLNGLFEKWLKEVFQTSLEMVKNGGKGVKSLRVCLVIDEKEGGGVGIEEKDEGFMGTNLPNKIKICYIM